MRNKRWGLSLLSVLLMVTVLVVIATTMVALYTMNLGFTQGFYNGSVALNEAEAGINEVMFWLTRDDEMTFGRNEEEIRGTLTEEFGASEAFHVVTFRTGTGFPHSTNNTIGDRDTGYGGRTVPDDTVHVISTGYCRGRYRTVEAVITKPPFPFGLAASGQVHSRSPIVVKGTSTIAGYMSGEDRPGHLLCNSTEGVRIEQPDPPAPTPVATYITGFVKSAGPIEVEQPAVILGGIRPGADPSTLVDIDVQSFKNQGQPGVVTLIDDTFPKPQQLDIMYYFTGDKLTYEQSVNLKQAMLYVQGDLEIKGPLTGTGLVVVDGDVTIGQGAALQGDSKLALLASGDVTIRGGSSFFQGLVYCEGNLNARDVTIVGNTIVTSADETRGNTELEQITFVSNEETANMTIVVTSRTKATAQRNDGRPPFPLMLNANVLGLEPGRVGGDNEGWFQFGEIDEAWIIDYLSAKLWDGWANNLADPSRDLQLNMGFAKGDDAAVRSAMQSVFDGAAAAAEQRDERKELQDIEAQLAGMRPDDPNRAGLEARRMELEDAVNDPDTGYAALKAEFDQNLQSLASRYVDYLKTHTDANGTYDNGFMDMNITREVVFDLNEYLPESERIKIVFWHVTNGRL